VSIPDQFAIHFHAASNLTFYGSRVFLRDVTNRVATDSQDYGVRIVRVVWLRLEDAVDIKFLCKAGIVRIKKRLDVSLVMILPFDIALIEV